MDSVTAKPRMGPVPNWKRNAAEMSAAMCVSSSVRKTRLNPALMDARTPRDGRVLEELGTYDPMVPETDARALLKGERIKYWLSVGAQPSEKCTVLIRKYGAAGTHLEQQRLALARLAQARRKVPPPPLHKPAEPAEAEVPAAETSEEAPAE